MKELSGCATFDAVGSPTKSTTGNVVNTYPSYDADNRPLSSSLQIGGLTYNFSYGYDLAEI